MIESTEINTEIRKKYKKTFWKRLSVLQNDKKHKKHREIRLGYDLVS